MISHRHVVGPRERDRRQVYEADPRPQILAHCHRGLRGPYTGVDTVLSEVLPDAWARWPELVAAYRMPILEAMPEFSEVIGPPPRILHAEASFTERTRFYGQQLIRCLSQAMVTFLREYAQRTRAAGGELPVLIFDGLQDADVTTQEFIALLARRVDAELWPVVIGSNGDLQPELSTTLKAYAVLVRAAPLPPETGLSIQECAGRYLASDGTTDDPAARAGYEQLDLVTRANLHDERADALGTGASWGTRVAAIAFHRERGSDPSGAGVAAVKEAAQYCTSAGFTNMAIELAERGRALVDPDVDAASYCLFSQMLITALIFAGRLDEAIELCYELRRRYTRPLAHLATSYLLAMVYARFIRPRDHDKALEWQNNAIVIASGLPDEHQRLVLTGFEENGLALIEMHRGNLVRALELVQGAMDRLDAQLEPADWALHRSQLLYNRTRLFAAMGRNAEAYDGFSTLIAMDPHYTDYFSERAKVSRKSSDLQAAIADYDQAVTHGPPFPELFHNRGSAHAELGNFVQALADFDLVLDMEPDDVETLLSRAELLFGDDRLEAALADVEHGLSLAPDDPRLRCVRGMIRLAGGSPAAAQLDFDAALTQDPDYLAALVNRAIARFESGDAAHAAMDLTRALELAGPDPDLLLNRGIAHAAVGELEQALADYAEALTLPDADLVELHLNRGRCLLMAGQPLAAAEDFRSALRAGPGRADIADLLDQPAELLNDQAPVG
ncbi:MAG TPA: tetratricopeptide repeat protein [Jatrophihabitans sp.]|nr:tetratricopeptide repeat protein [Jatrophihabitans sp.]